MPLATVTQIRRYPVKSMAGEVLDHIELTERGLVGDRAWAVRDEVRGQIVGALAGPEFEDPIVRKPARDEWIGTHDAVDLLSIVSDGDDDPTVARDLAARDQEPPGLVLLAQKHHVLLHRCIDECEVDLVDELDDEHGGSVHIPVTACLT